MLYTSAEKKEEGESKTKSLSKEQLFAGQLQPVENPSFVSLCCFWSKKKVTF